MSMEYIYVLVCPIDKQVKYVGKTKNPKLRYKQHITKLDASRTPKRMWLENLFSRNLLPDMKIIEQVNAENARVREQHYVTKYQSTCLNIHNPAKGAKSFEGKFPKKTSKK